MGKRVSQCNVAGMQGRSFQPPFAAVQGVPNQRTPQSGQVHPNLRGSSGFQRQRNQAVLSSPLYHLKAGFGRTATVTDLVGI